MLAVTTLQMRAIMARVHSVHKGQDNTVHVLW
jgi:hypothetical protein